MYLGYRLFVHFAAFILIGDYRFLPFFQLQGIQCPVMQHEEIRAGLLKDMVLRRRNYLAAL